MRRRYVLSPEAALDLAEIWGTIRRRASHETANRVEALILEKVALLSRSPGIGHARPDWTDLNVRFFPVFSYLIVYRVARPLQVIAIVHGNRDVKEFLEDRH